MSNESPPMSLCAVRLADEVLSAWHDTAIRGQRARQVGAHVASCVRCQVRLSAFEAVGALLRAQPIPAPRPNALIELNARLVAQRWRVGRSRMTLPHPGSWRGLLALIAALLLAGLFARFLTANLQHVGGQPSPYVVPHIAPAAIAPAGTVEGNLWQAKTS